MSKLSITTIKPTTGLFASFKPRSKEGEAEKLECFAAFSLPLEIAQLSDSPLRTFAVRAFSSYVTECLKAAVKEGKQEFIASFESAYAPTEREFLITRKDLEAWLDGFAMPLVIAAIATKSGQSIDSPKVIKKAIAYKETMLSIASRSLMQQDEIDSVIRVMELVASSGKSHAYTDNVATGISRKQDKLNAYLAGKAEDDEEIDF